MGVQGVVNVPALNRAAAGVSAVARVTADLFLSLYSCFHDRAACRATSLLTVVMADSQTRPEQLCSRALGATPAEEQPLGWGRARLQGSGHRVRSLLLRLLTRLISITSSPGGDAAHSVACS